MHLSFLLLLSTACARIEEAKSSRPFRGSGEPTYDPTQWAPGGPFRKPPPTKTKEHLGLWQKRRLEKAAAEAAAKAAAPQSLIQLDDKPDTVMSPAEFSQWLKNMYDQVDKRREQSINELFVE